MDLFQWGRKIQVDLTLPGGLPIRLVDFDSRRVREHQGLACRVEFTRHVTPDPQPCKVTVFNVAPLLAQQTYATVAIARNASAVQQQILRAGRIKVRLGRDELTMRQVIDDCVLRIDMPSVEGSGSADIPLVIEAQDGRLAWDNMFITAVSPLQGMASLGPLPAPAPPPPLPVYTHASVGQGVAIDVQDVVSALGYTPAQRGDTTNWIPIGGSAVYPVVVLDTICIPPIPPEDEKGLRVVTVLYNSAFIAGGPATLLGRQYVMDEITGSLATNDPQWWTARLLLRSLLPVA